MLLASAAVAFSALVAHLHDVVAYPALFDWDGAGHAVNVVDLLDGHWPNPRSWCGSHPPLFYGVSALLALVLPDRIPIHVLMRLVSTGAWLATVALVWRTLGRRADRVDAAVVAALLLAVPGLTIASSMMTNDALCAFFVTATLVRLLAAERDGVASLGGAAATGMLAGLAAVTKATGVAAVGIALAHGVWQARRDPSRGVRNLVAVAVVSAAIAAPFYVWLVVSLSGSLYDVLAVRAGSQEKEIIATVVHALAPAYTGFPSLFGLVHSSLWGDPTQVFFPRVVGTHPLAEVVWAGGLLVAALAVAGMVRALTEAVRRATFGVALVFGIAFAAALVPHALSRPYIVLTKTNYMLPEALPVGIVLALGLAWLRGGARSAARAVLLAIATAGTALTFYGWWDTTPATAAAVVAPTASDGAAGRVVLRYFEDRARDPVRALRVLTPEVHRVGELRLLRILGLPPLSPDPGLAPAEEQSLELARARVAWLELYNLVHWIQPIAGALDVRVQHEDAAGAAIEVAVAARGDVHPRGGDVGPWPFPSFVERFTLERDGGTWKIAGIEPVDVPDASAVAAFVAAPTMAGLERVRALGWRPPWERAIRSLRRGSE